MIPLWHFVPEWNVSPWCNNRGDLCWHDILWWYHVNKCRAMRGNRSELTPERKSPRCLVNTTLDWSIWHNRTQLRDYGSSFSSKTFSEPGILQSLPFPPFFCLSYTCMYLRKNSKLAIRHCLFIVQSLDRICHFLPYLFRSFSQNDPTRQYSRWSKHVLSLHNKLRKW